ncbi:unnamed protein product [Ectocarpus sp. 4 AP-2014]
MRIPSLEYCGRLPEATSDDTVIIVANNSGQVNGQTIMLLSAVVAKRSAVCRRQVKTPPTPSLKAAPSHSVARRLRKQRNAKGLQLERCKRGGESLCPMKCSPF